MLWLILSFLTLGRIFYASRGFLSGPEAYLLLCGQRLDWGFIEGPAGVPALIRLSTWLVGCGPFGVRVLSPCFLLLLSFMLWWTVSSLYGKRVAFWSVLAFNFLPLVNATGLVMDGAMIVGTFWMVALAWSSLLASKATTTLSSWIFYGLVLAITTQVSYCVGWLFIVVIAMIIIRRYRFPWLGVGLALLLLAASWMGPLWWNFNNEWLQWSQMTWGSLWSYNFPVWSLVQHSLVFWQFVFLIPLVVFSLTYALFFSQNQKKESNKNLSFSLFSVVPFVFCLTGVGHDAPSLGLQIVLWAMILPNLINFFLQTRWRQYGGLSLLCVTGIISCLVIFEMIPLHENSDNESLWYVPRRSGVSGVQKLALEILRLRALQKDDAQNSHSSSAPPFIIAQTPELASLLGALLPIDYPELQGAPSVFTPESPSFSSQFQLWPHYADAVASGFMDPLYTEEPMTSPFIGHRALYVTSELAEDLPETISGAFGAIIPVSRGTLERDHHSEEFMIYECENYQMMSL